MWKFVFSSKLQITKSGFKISISLIFVISDALITPGPFASSTNFLEPSWVVKADEEIETKDKSNLRQYGVGAQILSDLGVKNMTLLSNSKKKAIGLKGFNLSIVDWERLDWLIEKF